MTSVIELPVSEVVFREDLYPRIKHNQEKAQEYAERLHADPAGHGATRWKDLIEERY